VVVPAYNEAPFIAGVVRSMPAYVDDVIVVDDASSDGTAEEASRTGDRRLLLVRHDANQGVGAAIRTGYRQAFARGADVGARKGRAPPQGPTPQPPQLPPRGGRPGPNRKGDPPVVAGRADYVKGDRLHHPDVSRLMPRARYVANLVLTFFTRLATGYAIFDSQCGYTAISRRALAALDLDALYPRYGYPNDLLGHLALLDAAVEDAPVRPVYGAETSGISLFTALVRVPGVILRCFVRRIVSRRRAALGSGAGVKCASAS
jgi:glycosyltransferase involved in cell wall biosynthesis